MRLKGVLLIGLLLFFALSVSAQESGGAVGMVTDLAALIAAAAQLILCKLVDFLVFLAGAIAVLFILYAGIKFFTSHDDPGARKEAKKLIWHSIIALTIIALSLYLVPYLTEGFLVSCGEVFAPCDGASVTVEGWDLGGGYTDCNGQICVQETSCFTSISLWQAGGDCGGGEAQAWGTFECDNGGDRVTGLTYVCCI